MKKTISVVLVIGLLLSLCACSGSKFVGTWTGTDGEGYLVTYVIKGNGKGARERTDYTAIFEWEVVSENTIVMQFNWGDSVKNYKGTLNKNGNLIVDGWWGGEPYILTRQ